MSILAKIALVIVIIGAINWGLVGIFNFNLLSFVFDNVTEVITRILYIIVALAGIICISYLFLPRRID